MMRLLNGFLIIGCMLLMACNTTDSNNNENKEVAQNSLEEGIYVLDGTTSNLKWIGSKVASSHSGELRIDGAKISVKQNEAGETSINDGKILIDMSSLSCTDIEDEEENAQLVGHLKSVDFFDVENHPTARFNVSMTEGEQLVGELIIKGISKEISLPVKVVAKENGAIHVSGTAEIDRTEFDIKYNSGKFYDDLGDYLINDIFVLEYDLNFIK